MLSELDVDGAIQETAEAARQGLSRGDVLRRAALGGGALLGSGAIFGALPPWPRRRPRAATSRS